MDHVECRFAGHRAPLLCDALEGREQLGEANTFELSLVSPEPIDCAAVLRKACAVSIIGADTRTIFGVISRIAATATGLADNARRYRVTMRSAFALLEHRRRSRTFQHLTVPEIIQQVLGEGGYSPAAVRAALQASHEARAYVVQYAESDASFVRRVCEEEGLYFRFDVNDDGEVLVLEDTSTAAPPTNWPPCLKKT